MKVWAPPSPAEVEAAVQEMVRRIVESFAPEKIILFGSQARGDAGPDSDVDLLVVMDTESKRRSAVDIRMALDDLVIPKDVVVVPPDEFERQRDVVGTVSYVAAHEGRTLHVRGR